MLHASDRLNHGIANVMLSIGSVPTCYDSVESFTPSVSHYGLFGNSYVVSSTFSNPDFVDKFKGDSVDTDLKCIPWAYGGSTGEVVTLNEADMRVTHSGGRYVMLLRNYRPHAPRKMLDLFSYTTADYSVDIPVEGARLGLKDGDVVIIRSEKDHFCNTSRRTTTDAMTFNDNWQIFVCIPDISSFPGACDHLTKHGVCREIRERVEAFVETFDVTYDSNTEKFTFASNATRYDLYQNHCFKHLVKNTGRVYADGVVESDDDEDVSQIEDKAVMSFSVMTVDECGEGGRAKKRALDEGGESSAAKKAAPE